MKTFGLLIPVTGLTLISCNKANKTEIQTENRVENLLNDSNDSKQEEIKKLIRETLNWANSKKDFDLLPMITDSKDSVYFGFDLIKHYQNLLKLKESDLFATEFIDNYNQIILTLHKGLKNGEYEQWLTGNLPTFNFSADANPWCLCQDVPFDKPNPWDLIKIEKINLDDNTGEFNWKWGKLLKKTDSSWKEFKYLFRVVKENNKWKITYLQGFDFKESTLKD